MAPDDNIDPIELISLGLELSTLAPLHRWEPVGSRLDEFLEACRDPANAGITVVAVTRLRVWAARWNRLRPEARVFWAAIVCDPDADPSGPVALWHLLDGRPSAIVGWQRGRVYRAWRELYGFECPYTMFPDLCEPGEASPPPTAPTTTPPPVRKRTPPNNRSRSPR